MIRFKGENTGSIMMFDDVAVKLLKMMDTSGSSKGALMAEDIPAALASLQAELNRLEPQAAPEKDDDDKPDAEVAVSLKQRAAPLIDLLQQAIETDSYVTWGQ